MNPIVRLAVGALVSGMVLFGCYTSGRSWDREYKQMQATEHALDQQWYAPQHFASCRVPGHVVPAGRVCANTMAFESPEEFRRLADCNLCRLKLLMSRGPRAISPEEHRYHRKSLFEKARDMARHHEGRLRGARENAENAHQLAALLFLLNEQPERALEIYRMLPGVAPQQAALRAASVASIAGLHDVAATMFAKAGDNERAVAEGCLAAGSLAPLVENRQYIEKGRIEGKTLDILVSRWREKKPYSQLYVKACDDVLVRHSLPDRLAFKRDWVHAADFCTSYANKAFEAAPLPSPQPEAEYVAEEDLHAFMIPFDFERDVLRYDEHWEQKFVGALVRNREIQAETDKATKSATATGKPFDLILVDKDVYVAGKQESPGRSASATVDTSVKQLPPGWAGQLWLERWGSMSSQSWTLGIWISPLATAGTSVVEGVVTVNGQSETSATLRADITVEGSRPAEAADAYWCWAQGTLAKQQWLIAKQEVASTLAYAKEAFETGHYAFAGDILNNPEAQRRRERETQALGRFLGYRNLVAVLALNPDPAISSLAKTLNADLSSMPTK